MARPPHKVEYTTLTPTHLALAAAAWEMLYQAHKYNLSTSQHAKLKRLGASYANAALNALICTAAGTHMTLHYIAHRDDAARAQVDADDLWFMRTFVTSFLAWILYDLVHVVALFPRLGGVDTLLHHAGFGFVTALAYAHELYPFAASWLLISEVSSIPLNLRWYLINTGRGDTKAMRRTNLAFAATFFVARVLLYWLGVAHMVLVSLPLLLAPPCSTEPWIAYTIVGCVAGGGLLNAFWFRKIVAMAAGASARKKTKPQ